MDRLIINPATDAAWEAPLRWGRNTLGGAPDCDIILQHDTVATQHAEIEVSAAGVLMRDLSSESGTWWQGNRVSELALEPGLEFMVGEVNVRFEGATRSPAAPAPLAAPAAPVKPCLCRHHPREVARWHCPRCERDFCEACVNVHGGGHVSNHFCRACAQECEPLAVPLGVLTGAPEAETDFWILLPKAFAYPFQGNGPLLLAVGFVCLLLVHLMQYLARYAFLFGFIALGILTVGAGGYLFNYCKRIIETTANGEESPPDWPDLTDVSADIVSPFLQWLALVAVVFGPAILVGFVPVPHPALAPVLIVVFFVLGGILAPMAMLALAIYDRVAALNPALLIPSMLRCPLQYLVTAVLFLAAFGAYAGVNLLLQFLVPVPVLPAVLSTALSLYVMVAAMRVLGIFYRANRETLGWLK